MTDLEKFVSLYREFGIECVVARDKMGSRILLAESAMNGSATTSEKLVGYAGFYSNVDFDSTGKFVKQGFWE